MPDLPDVIRQDDYALLHAMVGSDYATPYALEKLTEHLEDSELFGLIKQGALLKACMCGADPDVHTPGNVGHSASRELLEYLLDMCPGAADVIVSDDCALLQYALQHAQLEVVLDLFRYVEGEGFVIRQHFDRFVDCLVQNYRDRDVKSLAQYLLRFCPEKKQYVHAALNQAGKGALLADC